MFRFVDREYVLKWFKYLWEVKYKNEFFEIDLMNDNMKEGFIKIDFEFNIIYDINGVIFC